MCDMLKRIQRFVFSCDMNRNDTDVIRDGTSEQQSETKFPLVRTTDPIAQNLFCTGARPRIAV